MTMDNAFCCSHLIICHISIILSNKKRVERVLGLEASLELYLLSILFLLWLRSQSPCLPLQYWGAQQGLKQVGWDPTLAQPFCKSAKQHNHNTTTTPTPTQPQHWLPLSCLHSLLLLHLQFTLAHRTQFSFLQSCDAAHTRDKPSSGNIHTIITISSGPSWGNCYDHETVL